MKVVGTFDPQELYNQRKSVKTNSSFAAMLAFNLDKKPGEEDVTALFGSNNSELVRLYEQMTGKEFDSDENGTVVFTFWNRTMIRSYHGGGFPEAFGDTCEEWLMPLKYMPSNQNMKYVIK